MDLAILALCQVDRISLLDPFCSSSLFFFFALLPRPFRCPGLVSADSRQSPSRVAQRKKARLV
jgi:hypothetical protein